MSLTADLSDDDLRSVVDMVNDFQSKGATATTDDFLLVWTAESGIRNIQTRIKNKDGSSLPFGGYNQMGPDERRNTGFHGSLEEWLALTMRGQMPFIKRYYESAVRMGGGNFNRLRDAGSLYVANFAPAFIGHAGEPDFPLYTSPSNAYALNKGLDAGAKGAITVHDMLLAVQRNAHNGRYLEASARTRALGGGGGGGGGGIDPDKIVAAVDAGMGAGSALLAVGSAAVGGWALYNLYRRWT